MLLQNRQKGVNMDSFGFELATNITFIILAVCSGLFFGFLFELVAEMLFRRLRNKKLKNL
jgi:hypothetical protein